MIIISNEKVTGRSEPTMAYNEFYNQIFGDGLEVDDDLIINANEVTQEVYDEIKDLDFVKFFSLTGEVPFYFDVEKVEDWSYLSNNNDANDIISNSVNTNESAPKTDSANTSSIYQDIEDVNNNDISSFETTNIRDTSNEEVIDNSIFRNKTDNNANNENSDNDVNDDIMQESIENLLNESMYDYDSESKGDKNARIIVFGSSKGGTGKTFTSIMSTYRYAKMHKNEKIALVDFDIIDGQVGISIHKIKPTMRNYLKEYQKGYCDFQTMHNFCIKANDPFPQNVDFYLAPSNGTVIDDDDFWFNIINNCIKNYDVVVFDTGIDYLNIKPISYAYKIADKVNLVTTTSIKSVNSVTKQISKLKGETKNLVFDKDDEIGSRLNIIITQMVTTNKMNKTIYNTLSSKCNIVATFGVLTDSISQAEFYGRWDVFDKNAAINKAFDNIMA